MTKIGLTGKYKISKFKAGEEPKEIAEFSNLITDWGLRYHGTHALAKNICVGSSATEPSVGDSDLKELLYQQNCESGDSYKDNLDASQGERWTAQFFTAEFTPKNVNYTVREIGFGRVAGQGIYSRSLTKDLDGNPTDIVVLADEYLRITYELRMYFKTQPTIVNFTPSGDDTTPRTAEILAFKNTYATLPVNPILTQSNTAFYQDATSVGDFLSSDSGGRKQAGTSVGKNITQDAKGFGGTLKLSATTAQGIGDNINFFFFGGGGNSSTYISWKVFLPVGFKKTNEDVAEFALHVSWGRK